MKNESEHNKELRAIIKEKYNKFQKEVEINNVKFELALVYDHKCDNDGVGYSNHFKTFFDLNEKSFSEDSLECFRLYKKGYTLLYRELVEWLILKQKA